MKSTLRQETRLLSNHQALRLCFFYYAFAMSLRALYLHQLNKRPKGLIGFDDDESLFPKDEKYSAAGDSSAKQSPGFATLLLLLPGVKQTFEMPTSFLFNTKKSRVSFLTRLNKN
jgi:hypothetical protein